MTMPLAAGSGLLAAMVGICAGGNPAAIIILTALAASFYVLAETRGWLVKSEPPDRMVSIMVTAIFAVFTTLFVLLTGGATTPLLAALYLPVLLASLCYGLEIGLGISLVMLGVNAAMTFQGHFPPQGLLWRHVAVGCSFPLVAFFGRMLQRQVEARYQALHSQAEDMSALLDMSQMMDAAADLDTTLNLVLLNVQKLTQCPVCAIYLKSPKGPRLELRAASGLRERITLLPSLPLNQAHCEDWMLTKPDSRETGISPCIVNDTAVHLPENHDCGVFQLDPRAKSFACVPMTSIEGLLGLLYVGYDVPYGLAAEGVPRLENLATRAAFSLQRVILQQDYQSLAYSDAMTGLDNFRRFEQILTDELRRAERYDRSMSLILLDIDHFKNFNDTLGHQAGDALLAQLATVLHDSLRSVDKPARYGGEEFVVLCPETGTAEALLIAERIRRNVEQTAFALVDQEKADEDGLPRTTHVTVSIGYATFPGDACNAQDLIHAADKALYAAKHSGRNAVRGPEESPEPQELHARTIAA